MSASLLREAAAKMRERAEDARLACGDERWDGDAGLSWNDARGTVYMVGAGPVNVADAITEESALYIASWHPAVALAVADWLEHEADHFDMDDTTRSRALAVARTYLGESA